MVTVCRWASSPIRISRSGTTQQQGLNSRGFKGCFLPNQEKRVQRFHELLNDMVLGQKPQAGA